MASCESRQHLGFLIKKGGGLIENRPDTFLVRVLFLFSAMIILYLAGVGIYHFEYPAQPDAFSSVFHSLWWAVATLTTVGYGDIYPITTGGKIFTFFILIVGLGIVSIPAGLVASALSKAREMEE